MQVDAGDFLHLKSCVIYTQFENSSRPLINVEVLAHVTQPQDLSSEVCTISYIEYYLVTESEIQENLKLRLIFYI